MDFCKINEKKNCKYIQKNKLFCKNFKEIVLLMYTLT